MTDPFAELKPALTQDQALAESSRCLFCFDAPCTRACPTHIDVPAFIKKIASGNLRGSAKTILASNVLGASCARVCPTEVLCEGACVLNDLHSKPIKIGQLQRHATDWAMARGVRPFEKGRRRPGRIAVIGAGPSGLSCAAELLKLGYEATVLEAGSLAGGLNATGVAEYKMTPEFAAREVGWLVEAGVQVKTGVRVGPSGDLSIAELESKFDAVFVGVGLGRIGRLGIPGDDLPGVVDAIDFIAQLKTNRGQLKLGRRVAVIGGGNTAVDAVTQAQRLGAEEVYMVYRRGPEELPAYHHELELAKQSGCRFVFLAQPQRVLGNGKVEALELGRMRLGAPDASGRRKPEPAGGDPMVLPVDMVIPATGQQPRSELLEALTPLGVRLDRGRVMVDERTMQSSNPRYFAAGDCVSGGQEVVNAVAEGKRAALGIAAYLEARTQKPEVARG